MSSVSISVCKPNFKPIDKDAGLFTLSLKLQKSTPTDEIPVFKEDTCIVKLRVVSPYSSSPQAHRLILFIAGRDVRALTTSDDAASIAYRSVDKPGRNRRSEWNLSRWLISRDDGVQVQLRADRR